MPTSAVEKSMLNLPKISVLIPSLYCGTYCNMTIKMLNHGRDTEAPTPMQQLVKTRFYGNEYLHNSQKQYFLISPQ
jgi:hypothetical protein